MKVEISADGILVLRPESPLESFAMDAWWEKFSARVNWLPSATDNAGGIEVHVHVNPKMERSL